jgi:hypothetical protein
MTRRTLSPDDRIPLRYRIFPDWHGRWWNRTRVEAEKNRARVKEVEASLPKGEPGVADEVLAHAEEIAQTAVDRAAAADRRATTIASVVSISATLTLTGSSLILDDSKVPDRGWQIILAALVLATAVAFVASAAYALIALIRYRSWNWSELWDLPTPGPEAGESGGSHEHRHCFSPDDLKRNRAAFLLHNFTGNWEISDVKNRHVDNALRCLLAALVLLVLLALGLLLSIVLG